jgi:hypothetical protein
MRRETNRIAKSTVAAPSAVFARKSMRASSMPKVRSRERVAALREVAKSGIGMAGIRNQWLELGSQWSEVKGPTLSQTAREGGATGY